MANSNINTLSDLEQVLDMLLNDDLETPIISGDPAFQGVATRLDHLRLARQELRTYTLALAQGKLDTDIPPRRNYLVSGVKQLHAQLNHLTWQAQCIAAGDYNQHVDFMGDFSRAFNTMVDQLRKREAGLRAQQDTMMRLFDTIEPIIITDESPERRIVYANHMAKDRFEVERGMSLREAKGYVMERLLSLPIGGTRQDVYDNATGRWYALTCSPLPWDEHGSSPLYHCLDITAHKQRESDLERAANTDELTGLPNRRAYEVTLEREWNRCMRSYEPLSMIIFDIDHFKRHNDTYGHLHGDKCLATMARALTQTVARSGDVIARYGGEEFVALLPYTDKAGALSVAESVRAAVEDLGIPHVDDPTLTTRITISAGVSTLIPTRKTLSTRLVRAADSALYQAKHSGRNCVRYLDVE
jgi:diguanylate cyclase (GGDEF)-like protein